MKKCLVLLNVCLLASSTRSAVHVFVEDSNGAAAIKYECTAGEVVRSFALDVSLDKGRVVGITNFFRGVSKVGAQGYGVFPAAFRDYITVSSGTNANWTVSGYTPLAVVADSPGNTLPGLNSNGVTLELGGLWDAATPATFPPAAGTLCLLQVSEPAQVSVAANATRGGVVSASSGVSITPIFAGALVIPPGNAPAITNEPASLTVCAGSPAVFRVGATGWGLTYQWQVSGAGGMAFTNISATATNANYTNLLATLADDGNQYQVTVGGAGGPSVTSAPPAVLSVNTPATASAGSNQTICAGGSTAGLGGSVGGGATGGTWSSSGTGTFAPNATTLNATYNPSAADIAAGTVSLTLSSTGQLAPCGAATAQVALIIRGPVGIQLAKEVITISFAGGELETAPAVEGPWTGTGNRSGTYTNSVTEGPARFYRVHYP